MEIWPVGPAGWLGGALGGGGGGMGPSLEGSLTSKSGGGGGSFLPRDLPFRRGWALPAGGLERRRPPFFWMAARGVVVTRRRVKGLPWRSSGRPVRISGQEFWSLSASWIVGSGRVALGGDMRQRVRVKG